MQQQPQSSPQPSAEAPVVPDGPLMPEACAAHFAAALRSSVCYLEYGAGGTTVAACAARVPVIVSVESDAAWLAAVRRRIEPYPPMLGRHLLHADIGPTTRWGHPEGEAHWRSYSRYPLGAWEFCRSHGLAPDLVLVDGRFRLACCLAALLLARPGCRVLVDDYLERPGYSEIERFAPRPLLVDRMAEFTVPERLPRDEAWLALLAAVTDPM